MAAKKKKTKGAPEKPSKRTPDVVDQARLYFEGVVATVRNPLVVLDRELRVRSCNQAFHKMFHVTEQETIGRLMYDLGNRQWDIRVLRRLLEEILPQKKQVVDFKVTHSFELIGERTMLLNPCMLPSQGDGANQILLAIEDITERSRMEAEYDAVALQMPPPGVERLGFNSEGKMARSLGSMRR